MLVTQAGVGGLESYQDHGSDISGAIVQYFTQPESCTDQLCSKPSTKSPADLDAVTGVISNKAATCRATRCRQPRRVLVLIALALATPALAQQATTEPCSSRLNQFNTAIDSGNDDKAQALVDQISTSADCGRYQVALQRRLAAQRLSMAQSLMARGRPLADFERLLMAAQSPEVLWQASATLGEVRFGERRFADAARAFDTAIEIVKNDGLTPVPPSKFEIESLIERAGEARLLAASEIQTPDAMKMVETVKDRRDGMIGGYYSRRVRGIVARSIPVPVTFEFRTAIFTQVGQKALSELFEVLQEQKPSHVLLVGHTDVRGTAEFNMRLSRERADAVAASLRKNGLTIPIETDGKGNAEPLHLADTSGLTQEDIYALNRRVEWRRE